MKKILLSISIFICIATAEGREVSFNKVFLDSTGKFSFTYPDALPNQSALQELQKNFIRQKFGESFLGKEPAAALSLYKNQNKEIEILKDDVSFPLPGIVQFVTSYSAYTGEAHQENGSVIGIYTLADGKKIELKSLFIADSEKAITEMIIDEFLRVRNLQSLSDYSYTQNERDFTPVSAVISNLGLDFVYPPYKLAPYAASEQMIFLSWNSLKPYLDKKSVIYQKLSW